MPFLACNNAMRCLCRAGLVRPAERFRKTVTCDWLKFYFKVYGLFSGVFSRDLTYCRKYAIAGAISVIV